MIKVIKYTPCENFDLGTNVQAKYIFFAVVCIISKTTFQNNPEFGFGEIFQKSDVESILNCIVCFSLCVCILLKF